MKKHHQKSQSTVRIITRIGPWTSTFSGVYQRDISKDVSANTKVFVDDTKMKYLIKNEDDVEKLQENLGKFL